ncbi:hypothetical protein B5G34_06365 [Flavonifractor sp. An82]|uniref:S-layer homology domain-containing protein n=1 Tax=Flavonifractor sp. An82 TaxID=1965660 RepID=UPI000B3957B2|nr:S-layer homology domain-containing protein [Flavonifractor sp. An82]OUN22493.1 hypothetical protein B5G34_06365 [Flavonifractor sp. An82]
MLPRAVPGSIPNLTYNGQPQNVTASVDNPVGSDTVTVTVTNGEQTNAGTYDATATALSDEENYQLPANATCTYIIQPKVTPLKVELSDNSFEYNGSVQKPTVTVKDGTATLAESTDYTVTFSDAKSTDYGTYTVTVNGINNYAGSTGSATYQITKKQQNALIISDASGKTYGDASFKITVTGGNGDGAVTLVSSDPQVLSLTPVEGEPNAWTAAILKAGTVTLTANKAGDTNYEAAEKKQVEVTIAAKALTDTMVTLSGSSFEYTGSPITPTVTVKDGETTLVEGGDYTVAYANHTNAGTATVTVTGKGNYQGKIEKTFTITPKSLADATVTGVPASVTYTGRAIEPKVMVQLGETVLVENTDYTLNYTNNTNAGTATITITSQGNYSNSKTVNFTIAPAAFAAAVTITGEEYEAGQTLTANVTGAQGSDLTYQWCRNGQAISGATGSTYVLTPEDAAAKITVKVTSTGNYAGTVESAAIEVGKTPIPSGVTLSISGGNTVGATLTATVDGGIAEADYSIAWLRDGKEIATGSTYTLTAADQGHAITAKLVAKGNYTGEVAASGEGNVVNVPAAKPSDLKVTASVDDGKVTLTWTAADNGSAIYQYQVRIDGKTPVLLPGTTTSYTFDGLDNGKEYTFTVSAINDKGTVITTVKATPEEPAPERPDGGGSSGSSVTRYTITVKQNKGGEITPDTVRVKRGDDQTFRIFADEGYEIEDVLVDGKSVGAVSKYIFEDVRKAHTIEAEFSPVEEVPEFQFADVDSDSWSAPYIYELYDRGIVNGVGGDYFAPTRALTRAEFVKMLAGVAGVDISRYAGVGTDFYDVEPGSWYEAYVTWAVANGVTTGTSSTTFSPSATINREQMAVMIYRYAESNGIDLPRTQPAMNFSDASTFSGWAVEAIEATQRAGIINGVGNNMFAPTVVATREQACKVLAVLLEIIEN